MVNRVWGTYFHTGIIHPTDDQNAANPPSNEPLLEWLAAGFVKNKYDLHWLHRQILNSHVYQRTWRPNATNAGDRRNFSRAIPRRLPAEVVYDAITQATAATGRQAAVRTDLSRRAIGHLSTLMAGTYAMRVFGKPDRTTNCDCERSDAPSLLQSILLHNDPLVQAKLNEGGWLNEIAAMKKPDRRALVKEAWLRTLSRPPRAEEMQTALGHLKGAKTLRAGMLDVLWALLNTKEFILNH